MEAKTLQAVDSKGKRKGENIHWAILQGTQTFSQVIASDVQMSKLSL